jgi:hypothetical protein
MKNKRYLEIFIPGILVIGLASIIITQTLKIKNTATTNRVTKENIQEEKGGNISLKVIKENSRVIVQVAPVGKTINLRAFALKMSMETKGGMPKVGTQDLTTREIPNHTSWSFPIKKLETNNVGFTLSLSGFTVGDPLSLDKPVSLVIINLPSGTPEDLSIKSVMVDNNSTRFIGNSSEIIPYQLGW